MPEDDRKHDRKHDRKIDALIAAGLISLRKAFEVTFILTLLQLVNNQVIVEADRRRIMTILNAELSERIAPGGKVFQSIVESVRKAGPDVIDYELTIADDFGLTIVGRLERAREQLSRQLNNALSEAILKEEFQTSVATTVFRILAAHGVFKRVMAYDTARAYNLQSLMTVFRANADHIRIRVSDQHTVVDICDSLIGVFPVTEFTGPPYRRLPPFHPFCNCYVVPIK